MNTTLVFHNVLPIVLNTKEILQVFKNQNIIPYVKVEELVTFLMIVKLSWIVKGRNLSDVMIPLAKINLKTKP